jgi:general stress protein 26
MDARELKLKALERFGTVNPVVLATVAGERPVQRRVSLIRAGARFYLVTASGSRKVRHLDGNDAYAALLNLDEGEAHGYVELTGRVRRVADSGERKEVCEIAGFVERYWRGPDDPELTMYELLVERAAYLEPGRMAAEEFDWS